MNQEPMSYRSMRRWYTLQSLPALVVAATVAYVVWDATAVPRAESMRTYQMAANQALLREDWPSAELYLRKLTYLHQTDRRNQYHLAMIAGMKGETDRARRLMQRIAPTERAGHAPAHLWLAKDLISTAPPQPDASYPQRFREIEKHLLFVIDEEPGHTEAHLLLGQIYSIAKSAERAIEHLSKAVDQYPEWRLPLAQLYVTIGNQDSARRHAEKGIEHYAPLVAAAPEDANARLQLAANQIFLEEYAAAEATLKQGLLVAARSDGDPGKQQRANDDNERFRAALVQLYVTAHDQTSDDSQLRRRLQILQRAIEYDPNNELVLQRLAMFADQEGPEAEQAIAMLQSALARGDAPATVHVILGTLYTTAGDQAKAVFHLEQGFRAHPNTPAIANNLAWSLAHADPPQLERALKLINTALKAAPNQPHMRDTRGVIYLKLGRPKEAVTDLEAALNLLPGEIRVRQHLATAYAKLGHEEMVREQRRMIAILEKAQAEEQAQ